MVVPLKFNYFNFSNSLALSLFSLFGLMSPSDTLQASDKNRAIWGIK